MRIQPESWNDAEAIHAVHTAAFPTSAEAELVRMLREDLDSEISLVARNGDDIVGHILLSRMQVEGDGRTFRALGLGPVAVVPEQRRQGIGGALIAQAIERAEIRGEDILFVLGEPHYYSRFGFTTQAAHPFASPYAGPYFMALPLGVKLPSVGSAAYAPAFAKLG